MQRSGRPELKAPAIPMVFDRGKAKYFHGRTQILETFIKLIEMSGQEKTGTTFLIQGAPGAGKTAILAECARIVKNRQWNIAPIHPSDLWLPDQLQQVLYPGRESRVTSKTGELGFVGMAKGEVTAERIPDTTLSLLRNGPSPLLLLMDEAQRLGSIDALSRGQAYAAERTIHAIHNGEIKKPVLLLAAGLGSTRLSFGSFGISRFAMGAFVELGALDRDAEHAVLNDWLKRDGGAKGNLAPWVHAIAEETHGWPQHILAYVKPALKQLGRDSGAMTSEGLKSVLAEGRVARAAYYENRASGITRKQRRSLANLFANVAPGESLDREDIVSSLEQDHGAECAQEIFLRAEAKGVITSKEGCYNIPIPSMHNWLVSTYAIESAKDVRGRSPVQGQEQSPQRRDQDAERGTKEGGQPAQGSKGKDHLPPPTKSSPPAKSQNRDSGMDFGL